MARAWPFFATLLENAELSLAKADPAIAGSLPGARRPARPGRRDPRGAGADDASWCWPCPATPACWTAKPDLQRAIEYRNPYVDALSFLQVRFLHEPRHTERTERLVQATISGVAAGLQNTG